MLKHSRKYCPICDEDFDTLCVNCIDDELVAIVRWEILKMYDLKGPDLRKIRTVYHKRVAYCKISDIEEYLFKKYRNNNKIINAIIEEREKRNKYKIKFIDIREELVDLINKIYDGEASQINLLDFTDDIKEFVYGDDDYLTSAFIIYNKIYQQINHKVEKIKTKKIIDNVLSQNFISKDVRLISKSEYYIHLCDTLSTSDMLNYVNKELDTLLYQANLIIRKRDINNFINANINYSSREYVSNLNKDNINDFITGNISFNTCTSIIMRYTQSENRKDDVSKIIQSVCNKQSEVLRIKKNIMQYTLINDYIIGKCQIDHVDLELIIQTLYLEMNC